MPACRCQNAMQMNVMRFHGKVRHDLTIKANAALEPWNGCQEPVEVTSTPPEAATVKGEA